MAERAGVSPKTIADIKAGRPVQLFKSHREGIADGDQMAAVAKTTPPRAHRTTFPRERLTRVQSLASKAPGQGANHAESALAVRAAVLCDDERLAKHLAKQFRRRV